MADNSALSQKQLLAAEFSDACHRIFEAYLAGINGLDSSLSELHLQQKYKLALHSYWGNRGYSIEDVKLEPVWHELEAGDGVPQRRIFETTMGELEKNLTHPGPFFRLLGRMAITFLYAAWEDRFRKRFAHELGYTDKDHFKDDLFGDLGYLRNAAVHNHGFATEDVEKKTRTAALRWFREGQEMLFSTERIDTIMCEVRRFCRDFESGKIAWVQPQTKKRG